MIWLFPPKPSILDALTVFKVIDGRKVWRNAETSRYYTWDGLHGEIEVFDRRGYHLGAVDPVDGRFLKKPVQGRRLNVQ